MLPSRFRKAHASEISWVTIGQISKFAGSLAGLKAITHVAPLETFGVFSLGIAIVGAIHMVIYGPTSQAASRFWSIHAAQGTTSAFFRAVTRVHKIAAAGLLAIALACLAVGYTDLPAKRWGSLAALATAFAISSGIQMTLIAIDSARRERKQVMVFQSLDAWLRPAAAVLFFLMGKQTAMDLFTGYVTATTLLVIIQFTLQRKQSLQEPTRSRAAEGTSQRIVERQMVRYAAPFLGFAIFGVLSHFADRWLIELMLSTSLVGAYAAVFAIASAPVALGFGVLSEFVTPVVFQEQHKKTMDRRPILRFVILAGILFATGVTAGSYVAGDLILRITTTAEIASYSFLLPILVLALSLFHVAQLSSVHGFAALKPQVYLLPKALQAVITVVAGIPLIQWLGIAGMGLAILAASAAYLVATVFTNVQYLNDTKNSLDAAVEPYEPT